MNGFLIGITGGVCSGKTTISKTLINRKLKVIDADSIAHQLMNPTKIAYKEIIKEFGKDVLNPEDKTINRKTLRQIVFSDEGKLRKLEEILHPRIQKEVKKLARIFFESGEHFVFYDAALLIEKMLHRELDYLVVIDAKKEQQIERLMKRDRLDKKEAHKVIKLQLSIDEKKKVANFVIDNSKTIDHAKNQLPKLFETLEKKFGYGVTKQ